MVSPFLIFLTTLAATNVAPLRPPAVPLVTHDPYFSIWSTTDLLTASPTKHWTGTDQPLNGLVRIDGETFRFIGDQPRAVPALKQVEFELTPTRTIYAFEGSGIRLGLTFLTPALPTDLDVLSRPLTYISFDVHSIDGRNHQVTVDFAASSLIAVNTPDQKVGWSRVKLGPIEALRAGTLEQAVLEKSGDLLRIDWGYVYLAAPPNQPGLKLQAGYNSLANFAQSGQLPDADELDPSGYGAHIPLLSASFEFKDVDATPSSRYLMLAYDDVWSLEYFHRKLPPYWRRNGTTAAGLLQAAVEDHDKLLRRSIAFDKALTEDLVKAGGAEYAALSILAYRQTLAAHKIAADFDGSPICMSKENLSNGSIDTVDVLYPAAPFFLLLNPKLLEAQMVPIFDYAQMPRWPWPYAPHDLGRYPLANGQGYGGGEKSERNQMPVEESGNMLILTAAIAKAEGKPDIARKYWPLLTKWAEYLSQKGLDPEEQLSTDDFAGHLAHNTNLALKAILALRSYSDLAGQLGHSEDAAKYRTLAEDMAVRWAAMADDGTHYRLAFDKPSTWSQKYNLVWDRILGYDLFPPALAKKEIAYYKTRQNAFGLPLDNRATYTKLDWLIWTATLADNPKDFQAIAHLAYKFANETPTRVPLSDWYFTTDGKQRGFQARSVVGGIFIKMLANQQLWKKWAAGGLEFPEASITNGEIRAKLYLPDTERGYYRATRFDWSGVVSSLQYRGHEYFGVWFPKYDPKLHDSITGPVEEFRTGESGLGYAEAKAGGTFIRIGVGVLRKPEEAAFDRFKTYDIVDPGKWTVETKPDSVSFTQTLSDPSSGYAYLYTKTVRLLQGTPRMVIEHTLKNTGARTIETSVYNHNFFVIDGTPSGPDIHVKFPFELKAVAPFRGPGGPVGKEMVYQQEIPVDGTPVYGELVGFGQTSKDFDIRVENAKTGAAVRLIGDHPLSRVIFWSIRTTVAPEPYIDLKIEPRKEVHWLLTYEFGAR